MKKRLLSLIFVLAVCLSLTVTAFAVSDAPLLYDEANLLSDSERTELNRKLEDISNQYGAQINIVTIPSAEGVNVDVLVENLYDIWGMGYGSDHDGVLLLVCMEPRQYRILSNGFAADAISVSDIETIGDAIVPDLSAGFYADAFDSFIDECAYYLDGHINGYPFPFGMNLVIALVIGCVAGLVTVLVMRGQLKSVRRQDYAHVYVKPGSMKVTLHNDLYLYSNVVRTKRQTSSSSGSRGSSRNIGGGSF